MTRALGLGNQFFSYRRYCAIDHHFNNERRAVLVLSEINLDPTATNLGEDCSLLRAIDHREFRIWTPLTNGSDQEMSLHVDLWEVKACHGIVLT